MYVGCPTDHPELAHVHFARLFTYFPPRPDPLRVFYRREGSTPLRKEPLWRTRTFCPLTAGTRHVVRYRWGVGYKGGHEPETGVD